MVEAAFERAGGTSLPRRAEVVVVGGGVLGASVALHLTRAGVRDVLVLEAGEVCSGSSGKPIGGVRAQFSDTLNVALAARSLEFYERLHAEVGIGLDQVGYLFLLRQAGHVASFEAAAAVQSGFGLDSRIIDVAAARTLFPHLDPSPYLAAAWTPRDGHARPRLAVAAMVERAERAGATVVGRCAVTGIDVSGGEITAVRTDAGTVATSTVVCAAGAWSRRIGEMVGVDLAVEPVKRQIVLTRAPRPSVRIPFTIDASTTFYAHGADRGSDRGVLMGMSDPAQAPGFERAYDPGWEPDLRSLARECAPALADLLVDDVVEGWAGLYEQTPDANALIGEAAGVGRFLYATGFSGHGFCQAPAAGEVVADLVVGRTPFVDVAPLRAERFAEHAPVLETNIV